MKIKIWIFLLLTLTSFILDQYTKSAIIDGAYQLESEFVDFRLVFNTGVSFSLFDDYGEYLKYFQITLLLSLLIYILIRREYFEKYYIPSSIFIGAGISNVFDRFTREGVVDFIFWHYKFDFAVFNVADMLINLSVAIFLYLNYMEDKKSEKIEEIIK